MENLQDIINKFNTNPDFNTNKNLNLIGRRKKVYQFDRNGKFLEEYKSICDAHKKTGIIKQDIMGALKGRTKFSQGYFWSENRNETFDIFGNYQHNRGYLVYDVKGLFIDKFETQEQIREKYNLNSGSVSLVLKGKRPHTKGFVIKYEK